MQKSCGKRMVLKSKGGELGAGDKGKGTVEEVQVLRVFWMLQPRCRNWNLKEKVFLSETCFLKFYFLLFILRNIFEVVISKSTSQNF